MIKNKALKILKKNALQLRILNKPSFQGWGQIKDKFTDVTSEKDYFPGNLFRMLPENIAHKRKNMESRIEDMVASLQGGPNEPLSWYPHPCTAPSYAGQGLVCETKRGRQK